jgi:hypothetical protein
MIRNDEQYPLPPELADVVDEYDLAHNEEVIPDYTELFDALRQVHELHPDWRFGQIVTNLAAMAGTTAIGDAYQVPDERLLKVARDYVRQRRAGVIPTL